MFFLRPGGPEARICVTLSGIVHSLLLQPIRLDHLQSQSPGSDNSYGLHGAAAVCLAAVTCLPPGIEGATIVRSPRKTRQGIALPNLRGRVTQRRARRGADNCRFQTTQNSAMPATGRDLTIGRTSTFGMKNLCRRRNRRRPLWVAERRVPPRLDPASSCPLVAPHDLSESGLFSP